jgi:Class II flagellar assembly regulator
MNSIDSIGQPQSARVASRPKARDDTPAFMAAETEAPVGNAGAASVAPATLASMLALQELGGETGEDRQARRHGHQLLGTLAELQRELLGGQGDATTLERLVALLAAVPRATDRRLGAMVSAIVVRARVELARRQV